MSKSPKKEKVLVIDVGFGSVGSALSIIPEFYGEPIQVIKTNRFEYEPEKASSGAHETLFRAIQESVQNTVFGEKVDSVVCLFSSPWIIPHQCLSSEEDKIEKFLSLVKEGGLFIDPYVVESYSSPTDHFLSATSESLEKSIEQIVVRDVSCSIKNITSSHLLSGWAVNSFSPNKERRLVVCVGDRTTDFVVIEDGKTPLPIGTIPVGVHDAIKFFAEQLLIGKNEAEHIVKIFDSGEYVPPENIKEAQRKLFGVLAIHIRTLLSDWPQLGGLPNKISIFSHHRNLGWLTPFFSKGEFLQFVSDSDFSRLEIMNEALFGAYLEKEKKIDPPLAFLLLHYMSHRDK